MKLSELIHCLQTAQRASGDMEVRICSEDKVMEEGYEEGFEDNITDVRLCHDWPLPGESLSVIEIEKRPRLLLFHSTSTILK
jgi:hypothetical protein